MSLHIYIYIYIDIDLIVTIYNNWREGIGIRVT